MKLLSHYSRVHHVDTSEPELLDLKPLIAPWSRDRIRRIDRYIEWCVAGGLNCVGGHQLPTNTGVYLATRFGAVTTSAKVMESIVANGEMPKPLHFVNTLGNSACFYLTRMLGTTGNTLVVSQEQFSFEAALFHAWLDLQGGQINAALVGGIDEVALPLEQHAKRLGVQATGFFSEGTHWLLLEKDTPCTVATESLVFGQPRYINDLSELSKHLQNYKSGLLQTTFIPSSDEINVLKNHHLTTPASDNVTSHGVYSGALLIALCETLNSEGGDGIHLAKNDRGHYFLQNIQKKKK